MRATGDADIVQNLRRGDRAFGSGDVEKGHTRRVIRSDHVKENERRNVWKSRIRLAKGEEEMETREARSQFINDARRNHAAVADREISRRPENLAQRRES